jgi:hypothetical protein
LAFGAVAALPLASVDPAGVVAVVEPLADADGVLAI